MSPVGLCALRKASVLAHAVSSLGLLVRHSGETFLTVCQHELVIDPPVRQLHPCAFRRAVCCAYSEQLAGTEVDMRGLPSGADPAISYFALTDCEVRKDGLIRCVVEHADVILLFASIAEPTSIRSIIAERLAGDDGSIVVESRDDIELGASLVFVRLASDQRCNEMLAVEILRDLLGALGVEEITAADSPYRVAI